MSPDFQRQVERLLIYFVQEIVISLVSKVVNAWLIFECSLAPLLLLLWKD